MPVQFLSSSRRFRRVTNKFQGELTKNLALEINKIFFEIIISKGFKKDALKILKKRKNIRLIDCNKFYLKESIKYLFLGNSFLAQDPNNILLNKKLKIVTRKKPSSNQLQNLKFAFNVCKFVKSNAIVIANNKSTLGIGSGQPSRLDSCKIASIKALQFVPNNITNCVAASDAFFPFADGIEQLINLGVTAIIQPGGSKNDKEVILETFLLVHHAKKLCRYDLKKILTH